MSPFRLPRRLVARAAVAVLITGLPLAAACARAAEAAPAPLRQALQTAWQQHPDYRATEAQLTAARARLDAAAQPLYNPELQIAGGDEGPDRTTSAGLNLALDLSGKRRVRRDAASARVDLATAEARRRRRDFVHQWLTANSEWQAARAQRHRRTPPGPGRALRRTGQASIRGRRHLRTGTRSGATGTR